MSITDKMKISIFKMIINVIRYHSLQSAISLNKQYTFIALKNIPKIKHFCGRKSAFSTFCGVIPIDQLNITYSRSSAPGGQNVNTVSTKVDLRFHVETANWLSDDLKKNILDKHKTKINKEGYIIIRSDKTRSQILNLTDAINKLRTLIEDADKPISEVSVEIKINIQKRLDKQQRERLFKKRHRSQIKKDRQTPNIVDF